MANQKTQMQPDQVKVQRPLKRLRTLCYPAIVFVWLLFNTAALAYNDGRKVDIPAIPELKNKIEQIKNNSSMSDAQKAQTIELLQLAITRSEAAHKINQQAIRYKNALSNSPIEQAALEAQTAKFRDKKFPTNIANMPLGKLESLRTKEEVLLSTRRKRAAEIDTEIAQEISFDVQASLEDARDQAQKAKLELKSLDINQGTQSANYILATVNHVLQLSRIDTLEQRLLSRNARMSLLRAEKKLLAKQVESSGVRLLELQKLITDHRQNDAIRALNSSNKRLESLDNKPNFIHAIVEENILRAKELKTLISEHDSVIQQKEIITREAQRIEQKYTSLTEQLKITQLESSPEFGAALRKQSDQLAGEKNVRHKLKKQEQAMTKSRLAQFQIDALSEPDVQLDLSETLDRLSNNTVQDGPTSAITAKDKRLIEKILKKREMLLKKLALGYSRYIDDLSKLTAQTRLLNTQSKQYAKLLNQQLLLMPTASPIGLTLIPNTGTSLTLLTQSHLWSHSLANVTLRMTRYKTEILLITIALFILLFKRGEFVDKLSAMKGKVGKVHRDSMSLTLRALLLSMLITLPGPLAMLGLAGLVYSNENINNSLAIALTYGALYYLILEFTVQCLRKNGLAELHFKWKDTTQRPLKNNLIWFTWAFCPMIILNLFIEFQSTAVIRDSLGRIVFVATALVTTIFTYRILNSKNGILQSSSTNLSNVKQWKIRYIAFPLIVLSPIVVATMSIYGYQYAATQLAAYMLKSILIVLSGMLLFSIAQRAAAINERRLLLERMRAKRAAALAQSEDKEAAEAAGEGIPTALDLQEIDLQTISSQTKALLKTITTVIISLALWSVWAEFLPAFQPLEQIPLWEVIETFNGTPTTIKITLWDLLLTIAVIVITYLAARNIPGLLEVALLSQLSLETGKNYAITTISRYTIVITGSIIALQLLGAQWSKLQWLIAALSVGLGFGLQEIVANFVSGIVILFERPIRIGDTVTIGDQFGTVSRIRIRATTIVDWDRREVIIPNKTFITERLINWTLTDPIMRTIIKVGVAYGSDVALVEKCLLDIANDNAKVLDDPPSIALFNGFGDSSLDFQLRVFLKGIHDLNPVIHEIHIAIEREFRNKGINISFPQRDLHFDAKPIDIRLVDSHNTDTQ